MMQRTTRQAVGASHAALQAGRFTEARDAAAAHTADPAARLLHALAQAACGDAGAHATLDAIARANPAARHPVHDLIDLLHAAGRSAETPGHAAAALARRPADPVLLTALGAALSEHGEPEAMLLAFAAAAQRQPNAATLSNLAKARAATGDQAGAEAAFAQATALAPRDSQLGLNHAVARLRAGRLVEAWPLFRARHALPDRAPPPPGPELRSLDGVAGQTVLLLHDEGFGDTIQFIRYAPMLEALGARVIVHAPPELHRLLAGNGFCLEPRPAQSWCRIPDLPALFGTTLETIPAAIPYLHADPALTTAWHGRLTQNCLPEGCRIGLAWAGAARRHDPAATATDRTRSIPAALLEPLIATPGSSWISLQHGVQAPAPLHDPMRLVRDFAETAAIIANLDLVISVDTAVAHLAAALGTPVLLLDRFDNCWRWLSGREDSPWYPGTLRIIRQHRPGDWQGVLARAAAAL